MYLICCFSFGCEISQQHSTGVSFGDESQEFADPESSRTVQWSIHHYVFPSGWRDWSFLERVTCSPAWCGCSHPVALDSTIPCSTSMVLMGWFSALPATSCQLPISFVQSEHEAQEIQSSTEVSPASCSGWVWGFAHLIWSRVGEWSCPAGVPELLGVSHCCFFLFSGCICFSVFCMCTLPADPLHVVNYVASSALKNQVYLQNGLHEKRGKSVGVSRRYLL